MASSRLRRRPRTRAIPNRSDPLAKAAVNGRPVPGMGPAFVLLCAEDCCRHVACSALGAWAPAWRRSCLRTVREPITVHCCASCCAGRSTAVSSTGAPRSTGHAPATTSTQLTTCPKTPHVRRAFRTGDIRHRRTPRATKNAPWLCDAVTNPRAAEPISCKSPVWFSRPGQCASVSKIGLLTVKTCMRELHFR